MSVSASLDATRVVDALRKLYTSDNHALRQQVIDLQERANALNVEIETGEREMNEKVFRLYRVSDAERRMIESA